MDPYALAKIFPPYLGIAFTETLHGKVDPAIDPAGTTLPDGYTVLITGAGSGVGEHIAKAFARAKATYIIINARSANNLPRVKSELEAIAAAQVAKTTVTIHVGDAAQEATYISLLQLLGKPPFNNRLDCLICNAGGTTSLTDFSLVRESVPQEYITATHLNYLGPYFAARHLLPLVRGPQSVRKLLINITSIGGHLTNPGGPAAYHIAKFAQMRLTQVLAEEAEEVVCVALHPGATLTESSSKIPPALLEMCTDDINLCGAVCVWFAREKRMWASGRYISSNWDMRQLEAMKDEIVEKDKLKLRMVI